MYDIYNAYGDYVLIVILLVLIAAAAGYAAARCAVASASCKTAYKHVVRTGVIRCGYVLWPSYLARDPKTGQMSGLVHDFMQALAQELGFRVEWVEEIGWGNFSDGLNARRFDMACVWASGARARSALLSQPLYFDMMHAIARENDHRFDRDLESINKPDICIAVIKNDATQDGRRIRFPVAQEIVLEPDIKIDTLLSSVATKKADVALGTYAIFQHFNASVPPAERLKIAAGSKPVQICGNVLAVRQGESDFVAMLNAVISVLKNNGQAQKIVHKYGLGFRVDTLWQEEHGPGVYYHEDDSYP
jgi:ABC-type amino acid transport substrate-binding protein